MPTLERRSSVSAMFQRLSDQIADNRDRIRRLESQQLSETATSVPSVALADAPLAADGMTTFALRFISDGRKPGEGAGTGTGILCYYDSGSDSWFTVSGNIAVTT